MTNTSPDEVYLANGLRYYAIEVTRKDGLQYGISAFDEEAKELQRVAMRLVSGKGERYLHSGLVELRLIV